MAQGKPQIPVQVQRRLVAVLGHLEENRTEPCSGAVLRHQSCSAGGGADIEELAASAGGARAHSDETLDDRTEVLFDPTRYKATQQPLLQASTLPPEPYMSKAWYRRELERVFAPSWTLIGRADEIAEPGKYLAIDTAWGGPVAVVRAEDGQLHAFTNVCAHRGAKILPDGVGQAPRSGLICPYHAWTYSYTGQLLVAPGMHKSVDFDESNVTLTPVALEVFHGFIFVNTARNPKPLMESLGDLPEKLSEWFGPSGAVDGMVCVARRSYDVPCNWKLIFENTCETYHTSTVHNGSLGPMKSSPMEPHVGDWDGVRVPTERTIVPLPTDFQGDNAPLPAFTNKSCFINLFPALQINVTWDCIWWMNTMPISETASRIEMGFCFPRETTKLDLFPSRLERYLHRWHVAVTEDNEISMNQTRGLRSVYRKPGRFCQLEFGTHNFNNWLLSKVLDGCPAWDPGRRVFEATETLWSNDDAQVLMLAEQVAGGAGKRDAQVPRLGAQPASDPGFALKPGARVCVTGASGFIGLHVVQQLLARGCHVVAAMRDTSDKRKVSPLLAMQASASGQGALSIVGGCEALTPGSFDTAVADCEVCFHLASPFWMDDRISDPQTQLIAPAEQGTLNLLRACAKSAGMRRVVITSSFGAIMNIGGNKPWPLDFRYSEEHWNESSAPVSGVFPEPRNAHAYRWSKTVAERAAWDFVAAEKPSFSVTCICPPMVLGPNLQSMSSAGELNQSSLIILKMLTGEMKHVMPGSTGFVDVRDVAQAHILACERPAAISQRYLCSAESQSWLHVSDTLRELFPDRPLPSACEDGATHPRPTLDNAKIKRDLGIVFTPLVDTLQAQAGSLMASGLLG